MDALRDILPKTLKKSKPPPHERAFWVEETRKMLGRPFSQILGLTKKWSISQIKEQYLLHYKTANPEVYWWASRKRWKNLTQKNMELQTKKDT